MNLSKLKIFSDDKVFTKQNKRCLSETQKPRNGNSEKEKP